MYEKGKRKAMKKKKTQLLGIVLSAAMLATSVPMPAYAEPTDNVAEEENSDAAAVQETTDEADAVADDAATVDDATDDSTAVDDATPEEADEQDTVDEADDADAQAAAEGENEVKVDGGYTISIPTINFQGANAAVAEQLTKDVEIDESDPAIQSLRKALEEVEIVGGEAGTESNESNISTADLYEADEQAETKKLTEDQINTVVGMYQQYLNQWSANANVLGVQNPFFLDFNDDTDGLGILGEMLALDGKSVQDVRDGKVSYNDLTGMISTFTYGDKLGIEHYGPNVTNARDEALAAVAASGAQTKAQKLLVLNDWLAHNNTFDMSYIMNSGKESDDDKPMIAENPQPQEHENDVHTAIENDYTDSLTKNFHDQIYAGIVNDIRNKYYEGAIQNIKYQQLLGKSEDEATEDEKTEAKNKAETYVNENKETIEKDPDAFVRSNFGDETADQIKQGADAQVEEAEKTGVAQDPSKPDEKYTVEQMTQGAMATEKVVDLDQDGVNDTTANDAIPIYAKQAADGMTPGVINYWEGTQFGAFGMGTSVCLGYSKAYTYLVQCLDKDIYLVDPSKGYDSKKTVTADDGTTSEVCDNWKEAKELYYTDGKLDTSKNYTVDLVRISFQSDVTMYGEEQEDFGSDHYWNAVKVDGQWFYVDPCYTDVYTEVMSRDRVETDGDMNHTYFLFSDTSARKLYDGNFNSQTGLRSLYEKEATDKTYETAWMARAASNVYYADGYAYYMYDSTDLFDRVNSTSMNQSQKAAEYKIVRHKLTEKDAGDGDSDYETLINFTDKENDDDDDTFVSVLKDGKMVKNDLLTKLYAQFVDEQSIYPSIGLTAALYTDGKIYFNVSNDIVSYNPADGAVAVVKEYNTVSAKRDNTKLFGGMAFTTTDEKSAGFTVTNHPIAGLTVKGDKLIVSIGTNFAFISGKTGLLDHTSSGRYGYQFEETDYNPTYTNYKKYQQFMGSQNNDNDEFMWSANFVDTVDMKTLTGTSHNYVTVSEPAYCGRNAFTEERCSDCGLIKDGTRVEAENTAHEHHYIKFHETYYTKADSGSWNEADNYVCPECGACITEPVKSNYEQANSTYEKRKAIWDAAIKNEAEGHTYVPTDAKWSDDRSTVTFQTLKCESCADKIDKLDCLLSSDDNATNKANRDSINKTLDKAVTVDAKLVSSTGTCDKGVTNVYKAAGTTEDGVKYLVSEEVSNEAGQHTYGNVEFNWDAAAIKDADGNITGYSTEQKEGAAVTVGELKCTVCGAVEENATVTVKKDTEKSVAPTCTEAGKDVYVATVTAKDKDDKEVTIAEDTKEVEVKALGHDWKDEATFNWTKGDNNTYKATATFTCDRDNSHTETVDATVTEKSDGATCTEAGKITYTAKVTFNGKDYEESKTEDVAALGHVWEATWNWDKKDADGNYAPVVTFTCSRDASHVETADAKVSDPVITDPTCETAGKKVYTATATDPNGNEITDTHEDVIDALGHNYGEPVWSDWTEAEDGTWTTTATFTCANDTTDVQTPEVTIKFETTIEPTYTTKGAGYYVATVVSPDGTSYTKEDTKEIELAENKLDVVQNVKVSWDKMDDADGYLIYGKRGSDGKYGYIGMTESQTAYVDKNAAADKYNFYWIYAYCKDSTGKRFVGKTPNYVYGKAKKCAAVTDLKTAGVAGGVKLSWTQSAGAEGYLIYGKYGKDGKYGYIGMTTNATTYTDQKASTTDYNFYWVYPYYKDADGNRVVGDAAPYVYGKAKVFEAVTNLKATGVAGGVKLSWTKSKTSGVQGYLIYGKRGNGERAYIGMTSSATYTDVKALTTDYNFYWVYPYYKDASGKRIIGEAAPYVYGKAK